MFLKQYVNNLVLYVGHPIVIYERQWTNKNSQSQVYLWPCMKGWWLYLCNRLCTRSVMSSGRAAVTNNMPSTGRMNSFINPAYLKILNYV